MYQYGDAQTNGMHTGKSTFNISGKMLSEFPFVEIMQELAVGGRTSARVVESVTVWEWH